MERSRGAPVAVVQSSRRAPERVEPAVGTGGDDGVDLLELALRTSARAHRAATGDDPKDGAQGVRESPKRDSEGRGRDVHHGVFGTERTREVANRHHPANNDVFIRPSIAPQSTLDFHRHSLRLLDSHRLSDWRNLKFEQNTPIAQIDPFALQRFFCLRVENTRQSPLPRLVAHRSRRKMLNQGTHPLLHERLHLAFHLRLQQLAPHLAFQRASTIDRLFRSISLPRAVRRSHRALRSPRRARHRSG